MPLLKQVLEAYPDQIKIVFKNFPIKNHKYAFKAATAAHAAEKQGQFWAFHDRLFENYKKLNDKMVDQIAQELGLNLEQLKADMKNPEINARIKRDMQDAVKAGVRSTPSVFVNGKLLRNRKIEGFRKAIDEALKKSGA